MTPAAMMRHLRKSAGLSQEQLAARIGMSRFTVNQLEREQRAFTPNVALRLERFFHRVDASEWMRMQVKRDILAAQKEFAADIAAIEPLVGSGD